MRFVSSFGRCLGLFCALGLPLSLSAGELKIGGTGAAIGAFKQLAQEYRRQQPEAEITVLPSLGSGGGIKAVLKGKIALGVSARPLKEKEREAGAVARLWALTPFVFTTSTRTGQDGRGFSSAQILDVYADRLKHWPGGQRLLPVLRPENDSHSAMLVRHFAGMDEILPSALMRRGVVIGFTDQDAMDLAERLPGSITTAALCALLGEGRPLTALPLDGVAPSTQALAEGHYPYSVALYLVTRGEPDGELRDLIEYLHSPAASASLAGLGLVVQ